MPEIIFFHGRGASTLLIEGIMVADGSGNDRKYFKMEYRVEGLVARQLRLIFDHLNFSRFFQRDTMHLTRAV